MLLARSARALALALVTISAWTAASASAAPPPKVYIAMGDSLTRCCGAAGQYPERFLRVLEQRGAADELENIGVPGETSSTILGAQLSRGLRLIADPRTDATVLTLDVGVNDLGTNPGCHPSSPGFSLAACQPTLAGFGANFASLLDSLDAALAGDPGPERVIALDYYDPWSGRPGQEATSAAFALTLLGSDGRLDCARHGLALGLNDRIACAGAEQGVASADLYPPFLGEGNQWFADVIHPNDAGQSAIAGALGAGFAQAARSSTPTLTVPERIRVGATSRRGALVSYRAGAVDDADARPQVRCAPRSGARFAIGTTVVTCSATDEDGNLATAFFRVSVRGAGRQLRDLTVALEGSGLPAGRIRRLRAMLRLASAEIARRDAGDARALLERFTAGVRREGGAGLATDAQADLVRRARRVRAVLR